ncbi:MAG TPA: methyltransferase [Fibrobacteraceae bacterium]|nr:methyltransferase [Fibrobacteraceae bacterium]
MDNFLSVAYRLRGGITFLWFLILWVSGPSCHESQLWFLLLWPFGVVLRIWARTSAGKHSRTKILEAPMLLQYGAYSFVRHPLYLSNILMGWGLAGAWSGTPWISTFAMFSLALFYGVLAMHEDHFLRDKFPKQWPEWKKQVGALLPRKWSGKIEQGEHSVLQAIWGDFWTWLLWAAGITCLSFQWKHLCST